MRAAPGYQVSWPGGAAESVGSPPPTSTMTPEAPGWSALTTRVVTRASRSSANSAAAVVSVLFVDAGCICTSSCCCQSSLAVIASLPRPPSLPRLGPATTAASVAASADLVGTGAVAATGTMLGLAVTAGGGGGVWGPLAPRPLGLNNAVAATTAATIASTPTPTIRCVDVRHWVGRMTLLTPLH